MDYKILDFDEAFKYIRMPASFWERVSSLSDDEKRQTLKEERTYPNGFLEQLQGLPLEEQMSYYGISQTSCSERTAYGKITKENRTKNDFLLSEYPELKALIVENGVLTGVVMDDHNNMGLGTAAYPYMNVCTYIASDNNGSGSNDRVDIAHLFCIMKDK